MNRKRIYPKTSGYWVYAHVTPDGKYYIGMSKQQPHERWRQLQYKTMSLAPYIEQYGWNNIEHRVLCDGLTKEQAEQWEDRIIQALSINGLCVNKHRSGGLNRDDKKAYMKEYCEEHKEEIKVYNKQYREDHKEEIKAYQEQYKENHQEERKAYSKQYREDHLEDIKQYQKQWYEEHKEEIKAYRKQYRNEHKEECKAYNKQYYSTPEGKIYNRVNNYNHNHPDKVIETPMEAKQKYLEFGTIPSYIKNDDLK